MSNNKIAVIGFGYWGKNHARVLNELGVLSGIYDSDMPHSKDDIYHRFSSFEELLQNSDAAVIATPAVTHFDLGYELIDKLDLLIEKPMTMSSNESLLLVNKANENNKILMVGHQLHFHPAIMSIKEHLKKGVIGDIKWIYSNRLNMGKIRSEENVLWSFAPHDISLILDIVGSDVKDINIQGSKILNANVEDATLTTLSFKNGIKGHIFVSWFHPFKEQRFVIVGEKGTFVFTDSSENNKLVLYETKIDFDEMQIEKHDFNNIQYDESEPLKNQAIQFISSINTRKCDINSGEHGKKVVEVLEASTKLL